MTVVASVDLSTDWGEAPYQGTRPTCLAFALSELNRYAHGAMASLSVEYLYRSAARKFAGWKAGGGLHFEHATDAISQSGQPAALACPYLSDEPAETPPALPALSSDEEMFASTVQRISGETAAVEIELLRGNPVGLILKVTDTFMTPVQGTVNFSHMLFSAEMYHAVVATGLGKHSVTSESFIRIRNSWGLTWGDAGNAWLPFSYLDSHAVRAFKVSHGQVV